jgi:hypothetical protein
VQIIRVQKGRTPVVTSAVIDMWDLQAFEERLMGLHARVVKITGDIGRGRMPDVREGDHCRFCPARKICPAKQAVLAAIGNGNAIERFSSMKPTTDAEALKLHHAIKQFKPILELAEKELKDYLRDNTIDVGEGRVLGVKESETRYVADADAVWEIISFLHDDEVANAAAPQTRKSSQEAMRRALRGKVDNVEGAVREIMQRAADNGALRYETRTPIKEFKAP